MATKRHYKGYTANEIAILRTTPSVKKCVRILKRTPQAIYSAKHRYGAAIVKNKVQSTPRSYTKANKTTLDVTDAKSISVSKSGINITF